MMRRGFLLKTTVCIFIGIGLWWIILSQWTMGDSGLVLTWHQWLRSMEVGLFGLRLAAIGLCMGMGWKPLVHHLTRHHPNYPACAVAWERKRWPVAGVWVTWDVLLIERLLG